MYKELFRVENVKGLAIEEMVKKVNDDTCSDYTVEEMAEMIEKEIWAKFDGNDLVILFDGIE